MKADKINIRSIIIDGARVIVLIVMFLVFWIFTDSFFSIGNTSNIVNVLLQEAPFMILLGLGMIIPMITGGVNLAIGSSVTLSAFTCAMVLQAVGNSFLGILVGLGTGALIGLVNGVMIAKIGVPAFVATYSMDWVVKGVALVISKGGQIVIQDSYRNIFKSFKGTYLIIALAIIFVCWFVYSKTTYGRKVYYVGHNQQAARLSGIRSNAILISTYVIAGMIAAVMGLMYIAKLGAAEPTLGSSLTMEAFAAALVGGGSFTGSKSKIPHALVGGLILVILNNGLIHIGVSSFWQEFAQGVVIIGAIVLERGLEMLKKKNA